ncbi:DUF5384 family protein [Escherichia coli]
MQKQKLALAKKKPALSEKRIYRSGTEEHKAAQTDVVQSEADANRNMTEGGCDLMKAWAKQKRTNRTAGLINRC